jgi:hypothetical protein
MKARFYGEFYKRHGVDGCNLAVFGMVGGNLALINVLYKRAAHPSKLRTSKLTKKWKNRTLISRQPLNNN